MTSQLDPNVATAGTLRASEDPATAAEADELEACVAASPLLTRLAGVLDEESSWLQDGRLNRRKIRERMGLADMASVDVLLASAAIDLHKHRPRR